MGAECRGGPTQGEVVPLSPRSGELDSLGRAARSGSGSGGAGDNALAGAASRSRGGRATLALDLAGAGAGGGLSSDEGGGEGENGESGKAEHGVGCRVYRGGWSTSMYVGRCDAGRWMLGV